MTPRCFFHLSLNSCILHRLIRITLNLCSIFSFIFMTLQSLFKLSLNSCILDRLIKIPLWIYTLLFLYFNNSWFFFNLSLNSWILDRLIKITLWICTLLFFYFNNSQSFFNLSLELVDSCSSQKMVRFAPGLPFRTQGTESKKRRIRGHQNTNGTARIFYPPLWTPQGEKIWSKTPLWGHH